MASAGQRRTGGADAMLRVDAVSKAFGGFVAVRNVSLSVERGRTACVIGPNGAGKSTLFNLITGHLQPTGGRIFFDDRDITGRPPHTICRMGIGRSFQRTNIFPRLSVFDNVQVAVLSHMKQTLNMVTSARAGPRRDTGDPGSRRARRRGAIDQRHPLLWPAEAARARHRTGQ